MVHVIQLYTVLKKGDYLEALGNKYKDLYDYSPQSLEMMPFV